MKSKNGQASSQHGPKALAALERAAKSAQARAKKNGTPCYVQVDGKIVDIAAPKKRAAGKKRG